MEDLIVLGVDPGLAATGFGVVERTGREVKRLDHGCIVTRKDEGTAVRLRKIYEEMSKIIQQWSPDMMALEEAFIKGAAPSAALSIGQVRGVLMLAGAKNGCRIHGIAPREVKLAMTGSGAADKSQIERRLRRLLGIPDEIRPDHAADALALAYVAATRG